MDYVCAFAGTGDVGVAFHGFKITFGVAVGDGDTAVGKGENDYIAPLDVSAWPVFGVGGVVLFAGPIGETEGTGCAGPLEGRGFNDAETPH